MRTVWPTSSSARAFSVAVKLRNNFDRSVSETICVPALRYWPSSTLRTPSSPSNGAFTRFCEITASVLATAALA